MFERASVRRVRVSVNTSLIAAQFLPGGMVWDNARTIGREMMAEAIVRAPDRTGELKSKHGYTTTPIGRFQVRATVHNDADYAVYVHGGTTDIYADMTVRPVPHSFYLPSDNRHRIHVRGQRPQPWLVQSMEAVMARYR